MSTHAKEQEALQTEIGLMREELREGLRQLNAIGPRPEPNCDAWELGGLRLGLQSLKERIERFELEARGVAEYSAHPYAFFRISTIAPTCLSERLSRTRRAG